MADGGTKGIVLKYHHNFVNCRKLLRIVFIKRRVLFCQSTGILKSNKKSVSLNTSFEVLLSHENG